MSEELKGGALYVYMDDIRWGVVETDLGPGLYNLVSEAHMDGEWKETGRIEYITLNNIIAIAEAGKHLASWEGEAVENMRTYTVEVHVSKV